MGLLKFIPLVNHGYYKKLTRNWNDESPHTLDEEDIIHIADGLVTNSIL